MILVALNVIVIAAMITFFIKSVSTFKDIKDDNEDYVKEMNKKGSRYMIISVLLVPVAIVISFKIIVDMFLF
ncbi:hypothetical protein [Clostridium sardiniense]|uniref:hypothetical protein n=1 Tax=Clostridium sardiniense TaxID=29369 RepID=UPI00195608F5|nr:hypothetical protein [Clostridium sardiniense]MBM7835510.1 heme/copper-type cytochrome/quinol oxidase subunit 2 [Clostridium sardiniense]